ncbi:MAG: valine--tRNA ligase [Candidatus Liptonbacteria bacterium RIFCSPHIGHO2_01_FULL_57_28]|uniref:Valine--tRNA ligase n=1 Tax=Candidatus Liptonbacteria bacterium RIFCSPHIGHO2_01_FULL_57_28 TaxID=1798647 RepID=A0A1G2C821_9BACT|nr:MAG: valine--tRNA ligase [Candidatus Liptonbacteria bacterium RIFCSPHIGHO2_01_FULL_57_28]
MPEELPPQYDHAATEKKIYELWEKSGYFNPDNLPDQSGEPYTIIMPPPNANAPLHVGHALEVAIQDALIRYQRLRGRRALWLPGMDHAGFETQVVFEKKLEKEDRSRFQMTREEFYKEVWDFVQSNMHIAEEGMRRLGASCDWSREMFTLDPRIVDIVYGTFEQMHKDGLIYRGNRICNWCTKHQTGLADLETKYEEREDPLYYIKYGPITLATVRPETKFGDTGIAVHPDDERYKQYIGQEIEIETLLGPAKIKVIADTAVDPAFGTGAIKVTPAHDPADFEVWQRHQDEIPGPLEAIDRRGKLTAITGPYAGLKVKEAREKVVADMQAKGLIEKIDEKYKHNVQICYKCSTVIEPLIVPQWYVAMTKPLPDGRPSLRDMALQAIEKKEVEIVTERFQKVFMHWMENLRDWPVSRQIWWGIPIPVKYCDKEHIVVDKDDKISKCPECGSKTLIKDPDTFDTWFSSGQWPFATLQATGKAAGKKDLETYFPTQVMGPGWDILFFWVARMIMLSHYRTGKPPFEKVLLHGLVRAADRQKMSKSKGNVVDPLGVIDTYGADALRFALIFSTAAGNDIPLAEDKIKGMKHFANKLWNIARFVLANGGMAYAADSEAPEALTDADRDILARLNATIKEATANINAFELHEAAQSIYQFAWREFADIYIEASKKQLADENQKENTQKILMHVLLRTLTILHPFMPFVTEEIYQKIRPGELLMISRWPEM